MKNFKLIPAIVTAVVAGVVLFVISCGKDSTVTPLANNTTGADTPIVVNSKSTAATWTLDKVHSNVMWETVFYGDNALLTGRFNNFDFAINFDQAHLDQSSISGWVQLSTFNTGEPGRDAYGNRGTDGKFKNGCGQNYMGVKFDSVLKNGVYVEVPNASTDTAWFKSTSIIKYGDGYLAKGNLTFLSTTKPVDLYFSYTGYNRRGGTIGTRAGFVGHFNMKAISDFKCTSTSIADDVMIRVDANLKKK